MRFQFTSHTVRFSFYLSHTVELSEISIYLTHTVEHSEIFNLPFTHSRTQWDSIYLSHTVEHNWIFNLPVNTVEQVGFQFTCRTKWDFYLPVTHSRTKWNFNLPVTVAQYVCVWEVNWNLTASTVWNILFFLHLSCRILHLWFWNFLHLQM